MRRDHRVALWMAVWALATLLVAGLSACSDDANNTHNGTPDDGYTADGSDTTGQDLSSGCVPGPDDDGDSLTNKQEGAAQNIDTDGDGQPDYLDSDSDNDTIGDALEAGDADPCTPAADSDQDGTPDFRELDADDDTIPDAIEGVGGAAGTALDSDGDGTPDFQDRDSDADGTPDRDEAGDLDTATPPVDSDSDGTPDYLDLDSDNDGIDDLYERGGDTDFDGIPDRLDLDSDGDGLSDTVEGGGVNPPRDSDGDGRPDFREEDSDNDGLSDREEVEETMTDPTQRDSDGDSAPDLVEVVAETDPNDPSSNPQSRGDFFFVVPYQDTSYPEKDELQFRTSVQVADLYFGFDASLSMEEEFAAMGNPVTGLPAVVNALTCETTTTSCVKHIDCPSGYVCGPDDVCVRDPLEAQCVPNLWTGVGSFGNLDTFTNILSPQPNAATTAASIPAQGQAARPGGAGTPLYGPWAEAPFHAAACVADGTNCTNTNKNCSAGGVGCPGFRDGAVRIYLQVSDADDQCVNPPYEGIATSTDYANITFNTGRCAAFPPQLVGDALAADKIKFIGLFGNAGCDFSQVDCDDYPDLAYNDYVTANGLNRPLKPVLTPETTAEAIGTASGTVDASGRPFVYEALNSAVVDRTLTAVRDILQDVPLRVVVDAVDIQEGPSDTVDASRFLSHFEVNLSGGPCTAVSPTEDTDNDGLDDAFPSLRPGTPVCWDAFPIVTNDFVEATDRPQVFKARVIVYGDGSPLDRRDVFFLVPPDVSAFN